MYIQGLEKTISMKNLTHFIKSLPLNPFEFFNAIKNSPYNVWELMGYFKRNSFGPSYKNEGIVKWSPKSFCLNRKIVPKIKIALIGDIMDMDGKNLNISKNIKRFIQDCDYLIGNFEATITHTKKRYALAQRHSIQIIEALKELFSPEKTFLNVANNHAGDFGYKIFSQSLSKLEYNSFQIFGTIQRPFVDIGSDIRIVSGTTISNKDCDYIVKLRDARKYFSPDSLNILYPHWGYDLELFPRPETVSLAKELILNFDAIIGHHAHTPQPVTIVNSNGNSRSVNKLIAYGMGDFCIWEELKHYLFGMIMKLEIGPDFSGKWQIGRTEWCFTSCQEKTDMVWETDIIDRFPFFSL